MVNPIRIVAYLFLALPCIALCQTQEDIYESAKLRIVEMWHEGAAELFRQILSDKGHSDEEIDTILFDAFYAVGTCMVHAAQQQAKDQDISEEILINAIGDQLESEKPFGAAFHTDLVAYSIKQQRCSDTLYDALGLTEKE